MADRGNIYESGEDYLETILILQQKKGSVRSVDIVDELGYSKSSVSRAVNILKQHGFINIDSAGFLTFTEKGRQHSQEVYKRHLLLQKYLLSIGVSQETAEKDACKIEHIISEETYGAIEKIVEKK